MKKIGVIIGVLMILLTTIVYAENFYIQPDANQGKDCWLQDGSPNQNFGVDNLLEIKGNDNRRTLIEFDLSSIPSNAIIDAANLELYLINKGSSSSINASIQRITHEWTEGTGNGAVTEDGATWNTYNGINNWDASGGDFDSNILAITEISSTKVWYSFNIKDLVQSFVNNSYENYGMIIRNMRENSGEWKFASSDNTNSSTYPKINIIYTIPEIYGVNISTNFITSSITSENINATYLISIGNSGTSENTYNLTVNNINGSDIALVNQSTITLNAGAVGNIILDVADETPDSYQVTVTATDSNNPNITATTETITTMVKDTKPPTYSNDADDSLGDVIKGTIVKISVLWKDNKKLDTVIFRTNQNGDWNNVSTCLLNSKSEWCNKTIDTSDSTTETICWNQYASDNFENWNLSMPETIHCFNVVTPDTTPSSISNLINQSNGLDFIYWTWTNPTDPDYLENIIYLNNINILNTTNNFYNATSLLEDTEYIIKIHTIDTNYNINNTNVTNTARTLKSPCVENWGCTEWAECINNSQTRICTDLNSCGTEIDKPEETQECVMPCEEDWICSEWSSCIDSLQTRTCTDQNSCGTELDKPTGSQNCTIETPSGGSSGGGGGGNAPSTVYQTEKTEESTPKISETKQETKNTETNQNKQQITEQQPQEIITSSVVKEPSFVNKNLKHIITSVILVVLAVFIYRNEVKDL